MLQYRDERSYFHGISSPIESMRCRQCNRYQCLFCRPLKGLDNSGGDWSFKAPTYPLFLLVHVPTLLSTWFVGAMNIGANDCYFRRGDSIPGEVNSCLYCTHTASFDIRFSMSLLQYTTLFHQLLLIDSDSFEKLSPWFPAFWVSILQQNCTKEILTIFILWSKSHHFYNNLQWLLHLQPISPDTYKII